MDFEPKRVVSSLFKPFLRLKTKAKQAKPASLIRSSLALYCSKDAAVLSFVGDVMAETLEMQLSNRALMTFFTAIWLDTLALSQAADLVQVALPTLMLLLKQPTQQDAFYAGVTVTAALCTQAQLEEGCVVSIGSRWIFIESDGISWLFGALETCLVLV